MAQQESIYNVKCNDTLPAMTITLTTKMIVMGATSSRDWQPIHHDSQWARDEAGLPNIIMNNYTQAGWISRYITDWCGPRARLGRLKFAMRKPLCPGDVAVFRGTVTAVERGDDDLTWVDLDVSIEVDDKTATSSTVRLAIPASADAMSPWHYACDQWRP